MSEKDADAAQLYNHTDRLLQGHRTLLSDSYRNQSFYRALTDTVVAGSSVLDIGSGTGIWAVAAAKLGAGRVVAIEYEPLLIGLVRAVALENGVADKVEVILGDSRIIELGERFDVVISETIGHLVFDESIVSIMVDARERFLKPGGKMIPQSVSLMAAAAHLETGDDGLPAGIPLAGSIFESLAMNVPLALRDKSLIRILTAPQTLTSADLRTISQTPDLNNLTACWEMPDTREINCFAVWAEAALTDSLNITTNETTSWFPMIYRVKPFERHRGEVRFELKLTSKSNYWTVRLTDGEHIEEQSYSPARAAAELLARSRSESDAFEGLNIATG